MSDTSFFFLQLFSSHLTEKNTGSVNLCIVFSLNWLSTLSWYCHSAVLSVYIYSQNGPSTVRWFKRESITAGLVDCKPRLKNRTNCWRKAGANIRETASVCVEMHARQEDSPFGHQTRGDPSPGWSPSIGGFWSKQVWLGLLNFYKLLLKFFVKKCATLIMCLIFKSQFDWKLKGQFLIFFDTSFNFFIQSFPQLKLHVYACHFCHFL